MSGNPDKKNKVQIIKENFSSDEFVDLMDESTELCHLYDIENKKNPGEFFDYGSVGDVAARIFENNLKIAAVDMHLNTGVVVDARPVFDRELPVAEALISEKVIYEIELPKPNSITKPFYQSLCDVVNNRVAKNNDHTTEVIPNDAAKNITELRKYLNRISGVSAPTAKFETVHLGTEKLLGYLKKAEHAEFSNEKYSRGNMDLDMKAIALIEKEYNAFFSGIMMKGEDVFFVGLPMHDGIPIQGQTKNFVLDGFREHGTVAILARSACQVVTYRVYNDQFKGLMMPKAADLARHTQSVIEKYHIKNKHK